MNLRQAVQAEQEASATQLMQAQIAAAAVAMGTLNDQSAAPSGAADSGVVAAVDADAVSRDVLPEVAALVESAPVATAPSEAPVLLAQAAQSESDRKGAVVPMSGGNGEKKDDDKGAAVAKDDDDNGALWGWLGGLGVLAAAGGGGGGSSPAPAPAPVLAREVLGGAVSGTVTEDGADTLASAQQLTSTKSGAVWNVVASGSSTYGTYTMAADGKWTYLLDDTNATVNALNVGSTPLTDTFVVSTTDGTQQTVTITINGANDAATVSGTRTDSVLEANRDNVGDPTATGDVNSTDVDNTNDLWTAVTDSAGTYGSLSMTTAGVWTYTLNNDNPNTQALRYGDSRTDTFTVYTVDGTSQTIVVTVNGATDYNLQLVGSVGGNGTALQENQSSDIFKANGAGSVPIQSGAFTSGMIIDIANDTGFALNELTYYAFNSTTGGVPGNGTFTLVAGVATYVTLGDGSTILSEMDYTPTFGSTTTVGTDDIMVMWDGSSSTNANYGYVLENVKINDTFTVEGLTFKYEGNGTISVITA